jgi:uncharacterized protein involved in cysteine biosynthesis
MVWSIIPTAITLFLYFFALSHIQNIIAPWIIPLLSTWGLDPSGWFVLVLIFFTKIFLFLFAAMTFSYAATLIACPFNDFLAERAEPHATPPLKPAAPQSISAKIKLILIDLLKTAAAVSVSLISLLLSWIPILNFFALILTFLLFTFQYISYPQTRRGLGVREGILFLKKHFFACLGFGSVTALLFSIPLVSCFVLPLAVVGGTLLFARAQETSNLPSLR